MQPVASLILQHLLRRNDLTLPGIGTFRIVRQETTIREGGTLLSAPRCHIELEREDPLTESVLSLITLRYNLQDPHEAEGIYNDWHMTAVDGQGNVSIENVGQITAADNSLTLDPAFEAMLDPLAGAGIVIGPRPQPGRTRLRPPRKNMSPLRITLIIATGLLAFLYIIYYLSARTTFFEYINQFID